MKIFLSIFGILLMIFGGVIIYGIGIQLFKGTSETSLLFDITLIGVLGVTPLIIGIWLLGLGVKKKKVYYEKDNRGTREMTKSQADSYW